MQLCGIYPIKDLTCRWSLNAYAAVEYFQRSGKSINGNQKTFLWSIPINVGLKSVYMINAKTQSYCAIGPRYLYMHQHNNSPFVYRSKSGNAMGFFVNMGLNHVLSYRFVIDIFGEYSDAKMHFHGRKPDVYTRSIQVGGFSFGGGLGYEF